MSAPLVLAVLLTGAALVYQRQYVPFAEIVIITTALAIFGLAFFPDRYVLTFALASGAAYLVWAGVYLARARARTDDAVSHLMRGLEELARGHYYKWIDDEEYERRYADYIRRFDAEGCDVALTATSGPDGSPHIHVMVHQRRRS